LLLHLLCHDHELRRHLLLLLQLHLHVLQQALQMHLVLLLLQLPLVLQLLLEVQQLLLLLHGVLLPRGHLLLLGLLRWCWHVLQEGMQARLHLRLQGQLHRTQGLHRLLLLLLCVHCLHALLLVCGRLHGSKRLLQQLSTNRTSANCCSSSTRCCLICHGPCWLSWLLPCLWSLRS
jgi:hypothetical protein